MAKKKTTYSDLFVEEAMSKLGGISLGIRTAGDVSIEDVSEASGIDKNKLEKFEEELGELDLRELVDLFGVYGFDVTIGLITSERGNEVSDG